MKINKIIILFLAVFVLSSVVNSATITLNGCGATISSGNTYILNFTEMNQTPCFFSSGFSDNPVQNVIIQGTQPINIQYNDSVFFYRSGHDFEGSPPFQSYLNNVEFKNIHLYSSDNNSLNAFFRVDSAPSGDYYNLAQAVKFNNVSLDLNANSFYYSIVHDKEIFEGNYIIIQSNILNNVYAPYLKYFYYIDWASSTYPNDLVMADGIINNSLIIASQGEMGSDGSGTYDPRENKIYNSVFNYGDEYYDYTIDEWYRGDVANYHNCILKGEIFPDVNDDGIGESSSDYIFTPAIYIDMMGKRFLQDIAQGNPFYSNTTPNVMVNDEDLDQSPAYFETDDNEILDFSMSSHNMTAEFSNIIMSGENSKIECNLLRPNTNTYECSLNNKNSTTTSTTTIFRPNIALYNDNIVIDGVDFTRYGTSNSNPIANYINAYYDNLHILNNKITLQGGTKAPDYIQGNHAIKLKYNNININNNYFYVNGSNASDVFELLYIDSSTASSNDVSFNKFTNLNTGATLDSEIFTYECDANFYNNYIGTNMVISNDCDPEMNNLVGYLHTNGLYYYFPVGNYYEDNTGCTDSDSDGFCDSPYTSGSVTDENPLSSYPFVYSEHLATAEDVVVPESEEYDITLLDIVDGETVYLSSSSDGIQFSFRQNSDYPNLICSYLIDDSVIAYKSYPAKNIQYDYIKMGGWTTKTYTYRVTCTNAEEGLVSSEEVNLNVIIEDETNVCGNAILEWLEECDDGNTLSGDGCSATCEIEGGLESAVCGNGIWEFGEQCDDGNNVSGDGCSASCLVETPSYEPSGNVYGGVGEIIDSDISTSSDNVVTFFRDITNGGLSLIIPIGIFFFVLLMVGGTMALIR